MSEARTRGRRAGPAFRLGVLSLAALAGAALASCSARGPGFAGTAAAAPGAVRAGAAPRSDPEAELARLRAERDAAPTVVRAHLRLVGAWTRRGLSALAREEYRSRASRPDASLADRVIAEVLASGGASSALRAAYARAVDAEPREPWWRLARAEVELTEADAWNVRRREAIESGDRAAESKAHGQARGALARAEPDLRAAGRLDPRLAEAELYLGHLRALEGDLLGGAAAQRAAYGAAAAAFERCVALAPSLAAGWAGLCDVRARLGALDEALAAGAQAARLEPDDPEARLALARLLAEADRPVEAVEQYRAAAALRPEDPEPWLRLGDVLAGEERYEQALEAYAQAERRDPDEVEVHARVGAIHEHRGRRAAAQAAYQRYLDQGGPRRQEIGRRLERLVEAGARP